MQEIATTTVLPLSSLFLLMLSPLIVELNGTTVTLTLKIEISRRAPSLQKTVDVWENLRESVRRSSRALPFPLQKKREEVKIIAKVFRDYSKRVEEYPDIGSLQRATSNQYKRDLGINAYLQWLRVFQAIDDAVRIVPASSMKEYAAGWEAVAETLEEIP